MSKWLSCLTWMCVVIAAAGVAQAALPGQTSSKPGQTTLRMPNLPQGVYAISFRLRIDRTESSVTPLANLTVSVPDYRDVLLKPITPILFDAPGTPKDFVLIFDNFRTQDVTAQVALVRNKVPAPKLTVERITMGPVQQVAIGTVWPGKILYYRNEDASGFVSVYNGTDKAQSLTLRCTLESDLDRVHTIKEQALRLEPGTRCEVPVIWNTGSEEYGFALAAAVLDESGQVLSQKREYFSVADNLWKVGITQSGRGCRVPFGPGPNESVPVAEIKKGEEQLAAELARPLAPVYWNYCNYVEFFAWAPDDFCCLAPVADYWYSGTGNYTTGKRQLQMAIEWLHRRGMRATTYLNPSPIGYGGDQVLQRHPERFMYEKNGQPYLGAYYEKKLEVGSRIRDQGPWELQLSPYALILGINIATPEAVDGQVEQIVKAQKMFGWDGVRYDNGTFRADGYDFWGKKIDGDDPKRKNELEARAWAQMRDSLWERIGPNFVVGGNFDYQLRDRSPAAWDESCRKGQLLMEEIPRSSWNPQSDTNRWQDFMTYYHKSGEVVRGLGGHHLIIGFDKQYAVDQLYLSIFTYAGRTHPYSHQYHSETLPLGDYAQFVTRYSALLWDIERVKALENPESRITVQSSRPVWWRPYACVRTAPDGKRQYIVHLVNPPVQERIYTDPTNKVPPPQTNVKVSLKLQSGEHITAARELTAEPVLHQLMLPLARQDNQVSVTVPTLHFWSVVVFQ